MSREAAYTAVQVNAMKVWAGDGDFLELLKADPTVAEKVSQAELEASFDDAYHAKQVETIFARVFDEELTS
jgi:adenylosuccinate lyase